MALVKSEFNRKFASKLALVGAGALLCLIPSIEAIAKTVTSTGAAAVQPTVLAAQPKGRTQRVRFAKGKSSAVVEYSVVRGTRDIYVLGAKARQKMTIAITSLEENAVFDIVDPNGRMIDQEATSWTGTLPKTGDYKIVVGGTRGNASYRMKVGIK
ncbi:hypothetical protein [Coleofasciculus sp. FACHB-1120]|uniref:hypothetical protein n=1 Tax=Coleofasciculus sp. FACHB-1120 TaxID=2692783 RepID=UPI001682A186|nr:hypothetical protein [Coleofasciculus sp. FACHB-1120]MBD2743949.1 hypothetical protein [Coleofasciculus sp. FACHB-1120]